LYHSVIRATQASEATPFFERLMRGHDGLQLSDRQPQTLRFFCSAFN
jgi:hypothetical protein